jgi:hypothetical protein
MDISAAGACIRGAQDLGIGESGSIAIQGFDRDLSFMVRHRDAETLRVEFDLGSEAQAYHGWFERTFGRAAA